MPAEYFDELMLDRQRLLWAVATRRQLERWEPLVAAYWRGLLAGHNADGALVWTAEIEHHFALIAAHHLFDALDLPPASVVPVDPILRDELTQGRDLLEHWEDNLPVFLVTPQPWPPPRRSGQAFAARNPGRSPYWWLGFEDKLGALLMPQAPAMTLHGLLDAVEAEVLASDPGLADYVPPRAPSPWVQEDGKWWPKPGDLLSCLRGT